MDDNKYSAIIVGIGRSNNKATICEALTEIFSGNKINADKERLERCSNCSKSIRFGGKCKTVRSQHCAKWKWQHQDRLDKAMGDDSDA